MFHQVHRSATYCVHTNCDTKGNVKFLFQERKVVVAPSSVPTRQSTPGYSPSYVRGCPRTCSWKHRQSMSALSCAQREKEACSLGHHPASRVGPGFVRSHLRTPLQPPPSYHNVQDTTFIAYPTTRLSVSTFESPEPAVLLLILRRSKPQIYLLNLVINTNS